MFNHKCLVNGPKNGLTRLQRMAKTGCAVVHWERAIDPTSRRLGISATEAQHYALETVQRLVATDYVEPVQQRGVWFDIYALYRDRLGWFVKIGEDDDGLLVISHHEPEKGSLSTLPVSWSRWLSQLPRSNQLGERDENVQAVFCV